MTPERPTWPEAHVWHTSLAAAQPDATLCDEQWSKIAAGLMDELGFSETPGRAPCPWVAIHHGPNSRGCDHVHIAVSLIREDGTVASIWQDKRKASAYMARVEREQNLYVVPGRPAQARPSANTERSWSRPSGGAGRRPTS